MKLLKRIANFFRALFSPREEGSPHRKVGYIADQLEIILNTVENYRLTEVGINIVCTEDEVEEIKRELDKRENLTYSIVEEKGKIQIYLLKGENVK